MNSRPVKISVIIPVYNVEQYLSFCLTSCVSQTLNDVEFICVNDGSSDNSLGILQEFASEDHRIKIIDKPNGGVSSARNVGLQNAHGRYIMFLDADDHLEPNACERVWCETLEAPTDIVIFSSKIFPHNPSPIDWYYSVLCAPTRRYWEFTPQILFDEPSTKPFIWHQAFRKELLDVHNISFEENIQQGEDMVFLFKIYPYAKYFSFIQDYLYNYRWYRPGSAMWHFQDDIDERISKHLIIAETISDYWYNQGWLNQYAKDFLEWLLLFIVGDIRNYNVPNANAHLNSLNKLIKKYDLDRYLSDMHLYYRVFAKTLKKGIS